MNLALITAALSMMLVGEAALAAGSESNHSLQAQFSSESIVVDGVIDEVWKQATPSRIENTYNNKLSDQSSGACLVRGEVRAMWDGAVLYLLVSVLDPNVVTQPTVTGIANRDGPVVDSVEFWMDHFNDKVDKFEEDDGTFTISVPPARILANRPQNTLYDNVAARYLKAYASALQTDSSGNVVGYNVEIAWHLGEHARKNGSAFGVDIGINEVNSSNTRQCRVFWNTASKDRTTDSNVEWGTVILAGYDDQAPMQLDTFMLSTNIAKANALVRGIWKSESQLNQSLKLAQAAMHATSQRTIDRASLELDRAIRALRRSGPYPDPQDLPVTTVLNDPFTFINGRRVKTLADWNKRREEIKALAQYYEFGQMPPKPSVLTATSVLMTSATNASRDIVVNMSDHGRNASFTARLTLPSNEQAALSGKSAPFPVIVTLDYAVNNGNAVFLDAGYAVLSLPTAGVQSDNVAHTGAIFDLYPYNVAKGHDFGCLLGWAWGASRVVDAIEFLVANDPSYKANIDLNRLAVTGFSRWGKGALAAGFFDERFKVTAPGASGSGGAAPYRYISQGHVYRWGTSPGSEVLGDHLRHQTHNSNEMMRRFLNDTFPSTVQGRMYQRLKDRTGKYVSHGYGERLPYDHHLEIAAIAPRAVFIANTNDDYGNNAEGDAIGYEGAKPVFEYLSASDKLALDIYMDGGGHSFKVSQRHNLVRFMDYVLYNTSLPNTVPPGDATNQTTDTHLRTDPYLTGAAGGKNVYDVYYGGLQSMMPWLKHIPILVK